jgi:glycosyltransferase involved in cell wall biosynthesis
MLTVVTPTLNSIRFVESCLFSVSQLTIPHEHIIVDGGSTDGTLDYIRQFHPSCKIFNQTIGKGMYGAIHQGFLAARGDIFYWLNSDDYILPDFFTEAAYCLDKNHGDLLIADGWQNNLMTFRYRYIRASRYPLTSLRLGIMPTIQPSILWSRQIYFAEPLDFDNFLICGDLHMFHRMAKILDVKPIVFRKAISVFLQHGNSLGDKNSRLAIQEVASFVRVSPLARLCEKVFRTI